MTGPTGPTGPSGATGATGATPTITTAALMAHDETTSTVNTGNPILFTTTNLSSNVSYNPVNGIFTVTQPGQYIIGGPTSKIVVDIKRSLPQLPHQLSLLLIK